MGTEPQLLVLAAAWELVEQQADVVQCPMEQQPEQAPERLVRHTHNAAAVKAKSHRCDNNGGRTVAVAAVPGSMQLLLDPERNGPEPGKQSKATVHTAQMGLKSAGHWGIIRVSTQ